MPNDYTQQKTPIFTGINDQPVQATANNGSNASDLIAKFNQAMEWLNQDFANVGGGGGASNTASLSSIILGSYVSDTALWIKFFPYYKNLENTNNLFDGDNLGLYGTNNLNPIRYLDLSQNSNLNLTDFIAHNGAGLYFFVSGTLAGAYNDVADISQRDGGNNLTLQENSTLRNARIRTFLDGTAYGYGFENVDYRFTDNGGNYLFDTNYGHTLQLDILEVFGDGFDIDINMSIG